MSSAVAVASYRARFRKVLEYVEAHPCEDLAVERLSGIAALSKFHFHRQFTGLFGVGVYRYVQLVRLKRASWLLAFRNDMAILDVAFASGYGGPEAFCRAFRKAMGHSPSGYRKRLAWSPSHCASKALLELRTRHMSPEYRAEQVQIVEFQETPVAALEHRGPDSRLGSSLRKFIEWRKQNRLPPRTSATFNVVHGSGAGGGPDAIGYDLCAATDDDVAPNSLGVVRKIIPGGRCAMLRHVGSDDHLGQALNYLYSEWLPASGEELRDFPLFFQRVEFFPDVPEHEAVTDVYLPLQRKRGPE